MTSLRALVKRGSLSGLSTGRLFTQEKGPTLAGRPLWRSKRGNQRRRRAARRPSSARAPAVPGAGTATTMFATTADHVVGTLDWLRAHPDAAPHLEMETYTWEVLPPELKSRAVVDQLADEYAWTLVELRKRELA